MVELPNRRLGTTIASNQAIIISRAFFLGSARVDEKQFEGRDESVAGRYSMVGHYFRPDNNSFEALQNCTDKKSFILVPAMPKDSQSDLMLVVKLLFFQVHLPHKKLA